jgi:hypothetical protein
MMNGCSNEIEFSAIEYAKAAEPFARFSRAPPAEMQDGLGQRTVC